MVLQENAKITFTDYVTNEKVGENMAVKVEDNWAMDPAKRKLRYAGHILRGSGGELLQLVLEGNVEGRKGYASTKEVRRKRKAKRIERDKIKFIDLRLERWQVVRLRKAR